MPDGLSRALEHPGLGWLALAVFVAGLVRGFSGFGTAMIYLPVAGQFLPPFVALATLNLMDLGGPLPNVPGAWRAAHRRDLGRLVGGALVLMPLGLVLLTLVPVEVFRYSISLVSLVLLAVLMLGLRYRGVMRRWMVWATGGAGGFLSGATGVPGPPVILFYMASPHGPAAIRANIMLFLLATDWLMICMIWSAGKLDMMAVWIAVLLVPGMLAGNVIGAALFDPARERVYRWTAYAIIGVSAVRGLPVWG